MFLENGGGARPEAAKLTPAQGVRIDPLDQHPALVRPQDEIQEAEEGGLAGPAGTDDGDGLARPDRKGNLLNRVVPGAVRPPKTLCHIFERICGGQNIPLPRSAWLPLPRELPSLKVSSPICL